MSAYTASKQKKTDGLFEKDEIKNVSNLLIYCLFTCNGGIYAAKPSLVIKKKKLLETSSVYTTDINGLLNNICHKPFVFFLLYHLNS